jgi:hypothetical protein
MSALAGLRWSFSLPKTRVIRPKDKSAPARIISAISSRFLPWFSPSHHRVKEFVSVASVLSVVQNRVALSAAEGMSPETAIHLLPLARDGSDFSSFAALHVPAVGQIK